MTWSDAKGYFTLWPWPDKKMYCKKMRQATVARLDALWEISNWHDMRNTDKIKQCKSCLTYFSPGTSCQQLVTHATKCRTHVRPPDPNSGVTKRARLDPMQPFGVSVPTIAIPLPPPASPEPEPEPDLPHHSLPPPRLLTAHIDGPDRDPLRARVRQLQALERDLEDVVWGMGLDRATREGLGETAYRNALEFIGVVQRAINDITARQNRIAADEHGLPVLDRPWALPDRPG